jgi:hypothetical protein
MRIGAYPAQGQQVTVGRLNSNTTYLTSVTGITGEGFEVGVRGDWASLDKSMYTFIGIGVIGTNLDIYGNLGWKGVDEDDDSQ